MMKIESAFRYKIRPDGRAGNYQVCRLDTNKDGDLWRPIHRSRLDSCIEFVEGKGLVRGTDYIIEGPQPPDATDQPPTGEKQMRYEITFTPEAKRTYNLKAISKDWPPRIVPNCGDKMVMTDSKGKDFELVCVARRHRLVEGGEPTFSVEYGLPD